MKTKLIIFLILNSSFLTLNLSKAQMFWNQACTINSSATYIAVPNSSSLNITGSFTLEAWVFPISYGGNAKGILTKGLSAMKFSMFISSGRLNLFTNGITRLVSRSSNTIPLNEWTHVAATYNSSTSLFSIYINGTLDTSATIAGAAPTSITDSLFIGKSASTTPFSGNLDEVRIWNKALSNADINKYKHTSLGVSSGIYSGQVLSITFQSIEANGSDFSVLDMSGNGNNGNNRNVTAVDLSNQPLKTIGQNESALLDGTDDYLAGSSTTNICPTNAITLECWVYPLIQTTSRYIWKGANADNDYALLNNGFISAIINGNVISGAGQPDLNKWNHIAFTYTGSSGKFIFYKNGVLIDSGTANFGNINTSTDSLFIGGGIGVPDFNGYIDEVRIAKYAKSQNEIVRYMNESIDEENDPGVHSLINVVYNLDGLVVDNTNSAGPRLAFRNNAQFSHPNAIANQPVAPLCRYDPQNFLKGFYLNSVSHRIPETGTSGNTVDSVQVNLNQLISDVNFFVAINHLASSNIEITLIAPNNDSVKVFDNNTLLSNSDNIITVFDDNASQLMTNNEYISFSNAIRPSAGMNSIFSGDNCQGRWKIRVRDLAGNDTGRLYAWGVQINNDPLHGKNLNLSCFIQGFYNTNSNTMAPDTVETFLRNSFSPYTKVDSASAIISSAGNGLLSFESGVVQDNTQYYLVVSHRNSINTWSNLPQKFVNSNLIFDFRNSIVKAFGNNQILVDTSPTNFAFFGGDSNKDGVVDAADLVNVFNDVNAVASGYIVTDMTGDDFADASDLILTFNNAQDIVLEVAP